jgi:hypothetical protein
MLNSLLFVVRRRYFLLQPRAEIIMQNGNVVRRTRKMHSDIWQFRWREKTTDGKTIYRRRQIGTVDQIPDMDTARKAAGLLVPDLNARAAKSKPVSMSTYSTLVRSVGTEFKVMQELLRHSTIRSTLDVYTQAITPAKQNAQAAVMSLVFPSQ